MTTALYDFIPYACPCGQQLHLMRNNVTVQDYHSGTPHTCPFCETQFRYVPTTAMEALVAVLPKRSAS